MQNEKPQTKKISELSSGYQSRKEMWANFLGCWVKKKGLSEHLNIDLEIDLARDYLYFKEKTGVSLPKSYLDMRSIFNTSYNEKRLYESVLFGLLPLQDVRLLKEYDPSLLTVYGEYAYDSDDFEYFRYGIDQDDVARRFSYLKNSVVIGKYISDSFGYILLYPDSVTSDGEMEAAILFHSGEFRAPSFAELMRQLSYMDLHVSDYVPPYSQDALKNTCADKLVLNEIWWR